MLRLNLELKPLPKPPANTLYLQQHKEAEAARGVASLSRDTLPREAQKNVGGAVSTKRTEQEQTKEANHFKGDYLDLDGRHVRLQV
jgi:hypothetical protein